MSYSGTLMRKVVNMFFFQNGIQTNEQTDGSINQLIQCFHNHLIFLGIYFNNVF